MSRRCLAILTAIGMTGLACGDDKPAKPVAQDEQYFASRHSVFVETMTEPRARVRRVFEDGSVETRGLDREMTLAELLAALEARTTGEHKLSLRLDAALGEDRARFATAKVKLQLTQDKTSVASLVVAAIDQAARTVGAELDYLISADGVAFTRPRLAAYRAEYNVPKILGPNPLVAADLGQFPGKDETDDRDAALARVLTTTVKLRPWETVEFINGSKLIVHASVRRQEVFVELLFQIQRLSDVSVVMNARLVEVDQAFFDKHIAPLYVKHPEVAEPPEVVPAPEALFKQLAEHKVLFASDDVKLPRGRESVFLSRQVPFRFAAGRDDVPEAVGVEGLSFAVDPQVTADRRFVRLRITRRVDQLTGGKKRTVDTARGRIEVETPDVRRTTATGTVQIPDGEAIVMRADFRPLGDTSKDRVWLMVARPHIWIDAEMIERGVSSISAYTRTYGKTMWESEFSEEEKRSPSRSTLELTDTIREILQATLTDVLTNPDLKALRDFYGAPGGNKLAIEDAARFAWPKGFKPETHGYVLVASKPDRFANRPRVLGIRVDNFHVTPDFNDFDLHLVEVQVFNAGGNANGAVSGEAQLYYALRRDGKRWGVKLERFSPP